jgi:hypothetical protein
VLHILEGAFFRPRTPCLRVQHLRMRVNTANQTQSCFLDRNDGRPETAICPVRLAPARYPVCLTASSTISTHFSITVARHGTILRLSQTSQQCAGGSNPTASAERRARSALPDHTTGQGCVTRPLVLPRRTANHSSHSLATRTKPALVSADEEVAPIDKARALIEILAKVRQHSDEWRGQGDAGSDGNDGPVATTESRRPWAF